MHTCASKWSSSNAHVHLYSLKSDTVIRHETAIPYLSVITFACRQIHQAPDPKFATFRREQDLTLSIDNNYFRLLSQCVTKVNFMKTEGRDGSSFGHRKSAVDNRTLTCLVFRLSHRTYVWAQLNNEDRAELFDRFSSPQRILLRGSVLKKTSSRLLWFSRNSGLKKLTLNRAYLVNCQGESYKANRQLSRSVAI